MYVTSSEVLGVFHARVTGRPLPDLLEERIFSPLGMADTGFYVPAEKAHRFATEYERDHQTGEFTIFDSPVDGQWSSLPAFPSAGGGLVSTIDDYASFARLLLNGGIYEGHRIFSENSIRLMTRNHLTDQQRDGGRLILGEGNGWGYGLAVRVSESDAPGRVGSYGWNGGLGTTRLNDPQADLIAILLTQVHWTSADYPASSLDFLRGAYRIADSEH
jgi:CubicO group peptidase (beta-lactamase class C family)